MVVTGTVRVVTIVSQGTVVVPDSVMVVIGIVRVSVMVVHGVVVSGADTVV